MRLTDFHDDFVTAGALPLRMKFTAEQQSRCIIRAFPTRTLTATGQYDGTRPNQSVSQPPNNTDPETHAAKTDIGEGNIGPQANAYPSKDLPADGPPIATPI